MKVLSHTAGNICSKRASIYGSDDLIWGCKLSWEEMTQRFLQDASKLLRVQTGYQVRSERKPAVPAYSLTRVISSSCLHNCHQSSPHKETSCNRPIRYKGQRINRIDSQQAGVPSIGSGKEKMWFGCDATFLKASSSRDRARQVATPGKGALTICSTCIWVETKPQREKKDNGFKPNEVEVVASTEWSPVAKE